MVSFWWMAEFFIAENNEQILRFNRYRRKRSKENASIFDSALSHTRRSDSSEKNEKKIACPLLHVFACGQVSRPPIVSVKTYNTCQRLDKFMNSKPHKRFWVSENLESSSDHELKRAPAITAEELPAELPSLFFIHHKKINETFSGWSLSEINRIYLYSKSLYVLNRDRDV